MNTQAGTDEYRFLTFLFCDLVDSTPLSQALNHEDWRTVLSQFQATCIQHVQDNGGDIYEFQGDGFLFHFGYPIAREDSAYRAIKAALAIIDDCKFGLKDANALLQYYEQPGVRVRAGVHSDYVVIGTRHGRDLATGFGLAFTQRIHTCADPNTLVISEEARHLVQGRFPLTRIEEQRLKGIAEPVTCFLVNPVSDSDPALEAQRSQFVGRTEELAWLNNQWTQSVSLHGCACALRGEAGVGKSRLIREFLSQIGAEEGIRLTLKCSPDFSNTALYPVVEGLSDYFGTRTKRFHSIDRSAEQDRDSLEQTIERGLSNLPPEEFDSARKTLLTLMGSDLQSSESKFSEDHKHAILTGLLGWLQSESRHNPLCLIVEDYHWIDPSTAELLKRLHTTIAQSRILLLLSCRDEQSFQMNQASSADLHLIEEEQIPTLHLKKLNKQESTELLKSIQSIKQLPDDIVHRIVQRSDGIPLFIEESAAMLADENKQNQAASKGKLDSEPQADNVPIRLMDLLSVRLDSTGEARHTAALAATIGRQFSQELLIDVSDLNTETVTSHLKSLLASGLLISHENDEELLVFKHALVRDAAYTSLLESTRKSYHKSIGHALQKRKQENAKVDDEVLASHFGAAGEYELAIDYWLRAGSSARSNSNPSEALGHYRQVQQILKEFDFSERSMADQKYLQMYLGLGACHIALQGYASDDARKAYQSAEILAQSLGALEAVIKVHFGLETHYLMRGNFEKALDYAKKCESEADRYVTNLEPSAKQSIAMKSQLTLAQSKWALGNIYFHQAQFSSAIPLMNECVSLCNELADKPSRMAQDPSILSNLYVAWYRCETGLLSEALTMVEQAVSQAKAGGHAHSIGISLAFNACIHFFRSEYQQSVERASESISYSEKPGFKTWLAWAKVLRGRSLCESDKTRDAGLQEITEGLGLWENSGSIVTRPFTLALLAESLALNNQFELALMHIKAALDIGDQFGERYYEPEIYRVSAQMHLLSDSKDIATADGHFRYAIESARKLGFARSELRAANELTQLQLDQNLAPDTVNTLISVKQKIKCRDVNADVKKAEFLIELIQSKEPLNTKQVTNTA